MGLFSFKLFCYNRTSVGLYIIGLVFCYYLTMGVDNGKFM